MKTRLLNNYLDLKIIDFTNFNPYGHDNNNYNYFAKFS